MGLFGALTNFLRGPVGNNLANDPQDIRNTKSRLRNLGYFNDDQDDHGFITQELDDGIKRFQSDNDLRIDGKLQPGGETEKEIGAQTLEGNAYHPIWNPRGYRLGPPETLEQRENTPIQIELLDAALEERTEDSSEDGFEPDTDDAGSEEDFLPEEGEGEGIPPENTEDNARIGGFGQLPENVDATGRMIRDENPPLPERKPLESPIPERKPETVSPTAKGNELLDFIGQLESSNNYNIIVGGDKAPLTKMTVKEVQELQKERDDKNLGTPVGKYQIKDTTMDYLIERMGLQGNEIFDEKLQDQMGRYLLERRKFEDFKAGKISTDRFINNLSKEWAAIPADESNQSYWGNKGNNRALTDYKTVKDLLEK